MPNTSEAREAKEELLEKWGEILSDLTQQMIDQAREQGLDPSWFYPRKIIEKDNQISIHWSIRPGIEAALQTYANTGSAEAAAKIGAEVDRKTLEQLITDDTIWERE